ncbi:MAG: GNAT family N-acetyltransferase [Solirubrobacteraceae bacterium]
MVVAVDAEAVRPLRGEVLRPGQSADQLAFPGDDAPDSLHVAAMLDGRTVGVASVMRDGHPVTPLLGDWRVRGMATSEEMRGRGVGAAMLARCEAHARSAGGGRLWCNARVRARGLYERGGLAVEGELFDIPSIGAHYLMSKTLDGSRRARSFGLVADEYQRGRPGYPREAVDWLLGTEPLDVLDVGAGTGKLTSAVIEAGHRVIAVEPLEEMRSILETMLPRANALAGSAEELPLEDKSVDAVVVGAAFHWFDQQAALREIARVLRPPGLLGLLGNGFDTSVAWVAHVRELLGPPALEQPGHWPSVEELSTRFAEVEDRKFPHEQTVDRPTMRDLACSRSSVALMGAPTRQELLASLDALWETEPELAGSDTATLPWLSNVRRCRELRI